MGEMRNADSILVGKSKGKRPLEICRCRWEDYVRMDLREIGWVWTGCIWLRIGTSNRPL